MNQADTKTDTTVTVEVWQLRSLLALVTSQEAEILELTSELVNIRNTITRFENYINNKPISYIIKHKPFRYK